MEEFASEFRMFSQWGIKWQHAHLTHLCNALLFVQQLLQILQEIGILRNREKKNPLFSRTLLSFPFPSICGPPSIFVTMPAYVWDLLLSSYDLV